VAVCAADRLFIATLRDALRAQANPSKAGPMQAYMKSAMPYLGIQSTPLAALCRAQMEARPLPTFAPWRDTALALWRDAEFREERYAAIAVARHRAYRAHQRMKALPLYRELIVTGAWWDYVDAVSHQIGVLLRNEPEAMGTTLRTWAQGEDMWLRRSAIIAQLDFGKDLDRQLLYDCIEPSIESREFFLRKAIGWALRQYARVEPREVLRYVKANRTRLSGLSKREALKAALRSGALTSVP
jgi:3-methyladenine DNA glycosylase AlkD